MKEYKTMSMRDRVRKRAESRKSTGGLSTLTLPEGVELFKPEKGSVEFDILPYRVTVDTHPEVKKGELWYERTYLAHRNVGPDEQFLICPRTIGKRCPICEEYQKIRKDPNADEEMVDSLRPKERELFNVVLKDGDGEVMILDMSTFLFGRMLEEEIRDGDVDIAGFAELKGGKTLKVRWTERSMGKQKFVEAGRIDFLDRDDIDESALEAVVDLDKAMKILPYEEIEKIFQAGTEEPDDSKDDDSEDEEENSGKEQDDSDDEEDEEEEEKPARRVIGKKKPKVEEEDDEEDDDSEDEEEDELPGLEKPKKKKSEASDCIACDGTGKTSKGKVCPICNGTGKDEDIPDETDDEEDAGDDDSEDDEEETEEEETEEEEEKKSSKSTRRIIRK